MNEQIGSTLSYQPLEVVWHLFNNPPWILTSTYRPQIIFYLLTKVLTREGDPRYRGSYDEPESQWNQCGIPVHCGLLASYQMDSDGIKWYWPWLVFIAGYGWEKINVLLCYIILYYTILYIYICVCVCACVCIYRLLLAFLRWDASWEADGALDAALASDCGDQR